MKAIELLRDDFLEVLSETRCAAMVNSDGDTTFVNPQGTRAATLKVGPNFVVAVCYSVKKKWFQTQFDN